MKMLTMSKDYTQYMPLGSPRSKQLHNLHARPMLGPHWGRAAGG